MIGYLFWGSAALAVVAALYAVLAESRIALVISAAAYFPLAGYLSATPRYRWALLLYIAHGAIGYAMRRRNFALAFAAVACIAALPAWLLWIVFTQETG